MTTERIHSLIKFYQHCLLDDIIPFWLTHSLDHEHGGFLHCLDRDGSVYNTDKAIWIQCRAIWMFSKLYNTVEKRSGWLDAARLGYEFVRKFGFDSDGRMFFFVTRDGRPLRKRRYLYSEAFGVIACAEYAKASGNEEALQIAKDTYRLIWRYYTTPGLLEPKIIPSTRTAKAHGMPMILIATTQELREVDSDPLYKHVVDDSLFQIINHFMKPDIPALLETVGPNGERLDIPAGRLVNPGHAIESAWFIMHEARYRDDASLLLCARNIIDWSLEFGWDDDFGGLFSFVDVEGKPTEQLEWDMKMWWTHTEALYALLLAHHLTHEQKYLDWFETVHEYTFSHFPDPEYGEWFAYVHRDGSLANRLKGSMWKGPFHIPRALWLCWRLLEEMRGFN